MNFPITSIAGLLSFCDFQEPASSPRIAHDSYLSNPIYE